MQNVNSSLAIIPGEDFRWRARVRFVMSFRTQAAAITYAFQHGYNLIVERDEGRSPLFDVMDDPDGACTAGLQLELMNAEDVLVEPYTDGWILSLFKNGWHLARKSPAALQSLYVRQIVPLSRHAAADIRTLFVREILPLSRRATAAAKGYIREMVPIGRHAAAKLRQADLGGAFARVCDKHLNWSATDLDRRIDAAAANLYRNEIAPRLQHATASYRPADMKGAFRRWCNRHLNWEAMKLDKRHDSALRSLNHREITPRPRYTTIRYRPAESTSDSRLSNWAAATPPQSNPTQLR